MTTFQDQFTLGRLRKTATYVDVHPSLGEEGREIVVDISAINAGLANLLSTPIGTCGPTFNPKYGGMLYEFLQEPVSEETAGRMRVSIFQSIDRWERRIRLLMSECVIRPDFGSSGYYIRLAYEVVGGLQGSVELTVRAS